MRRLLPALALAAAVIVLAGCGGGQPIATAQAAPLPAAAATSGEDLHELGRKVWNFRCYFCHGYSGDARTLAATYLQPPPRDFTHTPAQALGPAAVRGAIRDGKPGTAMKGFKGILDEREIDAVASFVRREFMQQRAPNTRYHTAENGWPDHERHREAFAFARGELALDTPWDVLSETQQRGKRLFLQACVSCHDVGRVREPGPVWETRALSYPRDAYCTSCHDMNLRGAAPRLAAQASAPAGTPAPVGGAYRVHDRPPALAGLDAHERRGEAVFQRNCAYCHAADGSGGSWIGRFLQPHPRNLSDRQAMAGMTRERVAQAIADGLDGTSMPAWKSVLSPGEIDAVVAYIRRAFHPLDGT